MGVYYANQSFVEFRTMILGIHLYVYIDCIGYGYTVSNFVQYVVTIAKLNLCLYTIFIFYICIPTNCTQLIYFINNALKHMYCLKL